AYAAYQLRARVRSFTAPCCETQRFDFDVSVAADGTVAPSFARFTRHRYRQPSSRPRTRRPSYRPHRVRGVLQGVARRTNRSLAACGSDAPDLHAFQSRVPGVASSAPERRRGTCRRDAERWAGERVAAWGRFSDGERDRKIKARAGWPLSSRAY